MGILKTSQDVPVPVCQLLPSLHGDVLAKFLLPFGLEKEGGVEQKRKGEE